MAAAVSAPAPALASHEAEEDHELQWTTECNTLIGQVLETQSEISSLLKTHDDNTESLVQMKQECDAELVELQEDAWKLQMLVELQRMGQQLERLASQEDEATTGTKDPGSAEQTAQDTQAAAGPSTGADASKHLADLVDLDKEIAELDRQLVEARAELKGLVQDKVALEGEVVLAGQQLQDLAVQEASH